LLAKGADPNAVDPEGTTALMIATRMGRTESVKALLHGHADKDLKDRRGQTAADIAREVHHHTILAALRNHH
jgi:ankyrin repeat protein